MAAKKKRTLEEALARLEEIAELMEDGDIALEDSLRLYKEGVELSVFCAQKLEGIKQEVVVLEKTAEGLFEHSFGGD